MSIDIEQLLDSAYLMVVAHHYEKAMATYNQVIEANSRCDEAYLLRGELFQILGQNEKAFEDIRKAISIDPEYDASYLALASLYQAQGELKKAIEISQQAIRLNESNQEAIKYIVQLCVTLADKQLVSYQPAKAVKNYQLAVSYDKNNVNLLYKYAFSVSRMGDFDLAINLSEGVLEKDENHVATKSLLASIYEKTGEIEKGWKVINSLVMEHPNNPFINITFGKYALRNNQQTIAIPKLQHALNQSGLKIDDQLSMHMLLGKLYDSISDYRNSFIHFRDANDLIYNDYDIKTFEHQVTNIISYFSNEKYGKLPSSSINSSECVFILGMPRSGTSLIEQIVSSHSKVYGGGELQNIPYLTEAMPSAYPMQLDNIESNELDAYANDLLLSMKKLSPKSQKITDKLPHNFLFIGVIHKLLPNAKIINCLRNPMDTCLSCYFQHFGGYHPYAYDLSHLGKYYQQYRRLMHHWEKELKIPILNVQYEELVQDTENEVKRILNYLELDWEDECLEFYNKKRTINTSSYTQVEKKIYTDSINRWINYELYITDLLDSLS